MFDNLIVVPEFHPNMAARSAKCNKDRTQVCILAGGKSRRMGQDKAALRLGRLSLVGHIKAAARKAGLPAKVIRKDIISRCGPIGGVYTALKKNRADVLLFVPCDMPFISSELLVSLRTKLKPEDDALFVRTNRKIGFPFLLRSKTASLVEQQIKHGRFALHELARVLKAKITPGPPFWSEQLANLNTPEEFDRAKARQKSKNA